MNRSLTQLVTQILASNTRIINKVWLMMSKISITLSMKLVYNQIEIGQICKQQFCWTVFCRTLMRKRNPEQPGIVPVHCQVWPKHVPHPEKRKRNLIICYLLHLSLFPSVLPIE